MPIPRCCRERREALEPQSIAESALEAQERRWRRTEGVCKMFANHQFSRRSLVRRSHPGLPLAAQDHTN